jgi:hypothetical protein
MMPSLLIIIAHAPVAAQARARYQLPLAFLRRPYIPGDIGDWNFTEPVFCFGVNKFEVFLACPSTNMFAVAARSRRC